MCAASLHPAAAMGSLQDGVPLLLHGLTPRLPAALPVPMQLEEAYSGLT